MLSQHAACTQLIHFLVRTLRPSHSKLDYKPGKQAHSSVCETVCTDWRAFTFPWSWAYCPDTGTPNIILWTTGLASFIIMFAEATSNGKLSHTETPTCFQVWAEMREPTTTRTPWIMHQCSNSLAVRWLGYLSSFKCRMFMTQTYQCNTLNHDISK